MAKVRTKEEARQWLDGHGVSISEFCRRHDLSRTVVTYVLNGRFKGKRGEAHRAAVLLGMKPTPQGQSPLRRP